MTTQSTTQYLKLTDGTIAYDDQGSGKLIICMPAGGDTRAEYRHLTPLLVAAGYRVVTMDIRGQGQTSAVWPSYSYEAMTEDVIALAEHLQAGPAIIVGTSKTAGVAVMAANNRPELFSHVTMMGPFARSKSKIMSVLTAQILLSPLWGLKLFADFYNDKMYPIKPTDYAEHTAAMRTMLKEPGRLRALRLMFSDSGKDLDSHLARLTQPTLLIMGEKDPDFPNPAKEAAIYGKLMHTTTPQIHIAAGAGHHPQAQVPQEVASTMISFLA